MELITIILARVVAASALQPLVQGRLLAFRRASKIATIGKERGSRVTTMIHREDT